MSEKSQIINEELKDLNEENTTICRFCLSEKDNLGNLVVIYDDGTIQHKSCATKYARNRRNLKKVIFKEYYIEYFGDMRPAGLVDRVAMKVKEEREGKSLKEIRKERRLLQKGVKEKMAHARACKERRRLEKQKEDDRAVDEFTRQYLEKSGKGIKDLIGETQIRESEG